MDTIPHSTMGDLVVGDYDLNPSVLGGVISANAFIYNMSRQRWTLLDLGGSRSTRPRSMASGRMAAATARSTPWPGSKASGAQRAFLMNYNERTQTFGKPKYFSYGNAPTLVTHFEGITAVPGGFHLVAISSAQEASMAFVPPASAAAFLARRGGIPPCRDSSLCPDGCSIVTGNTVYRNQVMGSTSPPVPVPPIPIWLPFRAGKDLGQAIRVNGMAAATSGQLRLPRR